MSDTSGAGREYGTVGTIVGRTFDVMGQKFPVLFGVALLFYLPSLAVNLYPVSPNSEDISLIALASVGGIVALLFQYALIGAVTYAVYAGLRKEKVTIGMTIGRGFRHMLPVLAVVLLSGIAIGVSFIFLIIPGIIVMIMLSVAIPALIVERTGIFESLSRSSELTKGYRWTIFGVYMVFLVIVIVLAMIGGAVFGLGATLVSNPMIGIVFEWLLTVLYGVFGAVLAPVMYFELRTAKEGLDLGEIASVFD